MQLLIRTLHSRPTERLALLLDNPSRSLQIPVALSHGSFIQLDSAPEKPERMTVAERE